MLNADRCARALSTSTFPFPFLGEPGDRVQFSEFIAANVRLHALRTETRLSTSAVAHYTRGELATALRKVKGEGVERGDGWKTGGSVLPLSFSHALHTPIHPGNAPISLLPHSALTSATCW